MPDGEGSGVFSHRRDTAWIIGSLHAFCQRQHQLVSLLGQSYIRIILSIHQLLRPSQTSFYSQDKPVNEVLLIVSIIHMEKLRQRFREKNMSQSGKGINPGDSLYSSSLWVCYKNTIYKSFKMVIAQSPPIQSRNSLSGCNSVYFSLARGSAEVAIVKVRSHNFYYGSLGIPTEDLPESLSSHHCWEVLSPSWLWATSQRSSCFSV